jgi:hypothetical protein
MHGKGVPLLRRGEGRKGVGANAAPAARSARGASLLQRALSPKPWLAFAVLAALVDVWGNRYNLNPDGISYVEMAQHALVDGPGELINGLWSPGYPSLLMWPLRLAGSAWDVAIPALHAVNLLLYLMALGIFLQLLRAVVRPDRPMLAPALAQHVEAFGAAAFASIALVSIGLGLLTPDVAVMLAVVATAACCVQLERTAHAWSWAVALGVVLGGGYWVKGILLPLNALLLVLLLVVPPRVDRAREKIGVAALLFVVMSLPLVGLVSAKVGRPTVGDVGRLNYAWAIDHVTPFVGWLGDSTGRFGTPVHPPRVLQQQPLTLEFATPVRATYPLWYDPSYWYAGLKARIDIGGQWRALRQGLADLARVVFGQVVLAASVIALWLATAPQPGSRPDRRMPSVLAAWSLAAAMVLALVHVEPRYLAGFIATGVIAIWAWLSTRRPRRALRWVLPATVVALALSLVRDLDQNTGGFDPGYRPDYLLDAAQLRGAGLHSGDHVGTVGDAFEQYAAFVAGTPITAQVMDSVQYWQLSPGGRLELQRHLAATGVKALLANNVAAGMQVEGWRLIVHADSSNLGVLMLRAP